MGGIEGVRQAVPAVLAHGVVMETSVYDRHHDTVSFVPCGKQRLQVVERELRVSAARHICLGRMEKVLFAVQIPPTIRLIAGLLYCFHK